MRENGDAKLGAHQDHAQQLVNTSDAAGVNLEDKRGTIDQMMNRSGVYKRREQERSVRKVRREEKEGSKGRENEYLTEIHGLSLKELLEHNTILTHLSGCHTNAFEHI